MSRYTGPKNRIARRFGANVFGRRRNPLLHKPNPPGMHGLRRRKKSDFGLQLQEQQKLKACYGLLPQNKLVRYYREAARRQGNTADILLQLLECRLDNIVYRLKFAPTIFAAHQLVAHGHVLVNGRKVDIRSFQVKPGMTISLREKAQKMMMVESAVADGMRDVPPYLESTEKFEGKLIALPEPDQMPLSLPVSAATICDFLAHSS